MCFRPEFCRRACRCQDQPSDSGGHDENNSISRCSALRNFHPASERQAGKYREKSSLERSVLTGTWCCNRCCLCRFRCRRAGAPGRTWHRCLCRKQKCNENQPDAAETDRGCGFDCDRVHQTLSLIENGASHSRYFSLQIKSQY